MKIGDEIIEKGERKRFKLEIASMHDYTKIFMPVEVIRGKKDGPVLFISAAIHGDEINGIEIIKRILKSKMIDRIKGTLILIPVVNVFGFNSKSRYLPDRRDLNRSFPGNSRGSMGSVMANIFMSEIVSNCTHGIDLHTGAIHRSNLSQIRAYIEDEKTRELAESFGAPVVINSNLRDGSLREAARKENVSILLFEGGEALRFNENVIKTGVRGCTNVMRKIGMLPKKKEGVKPSSYLAKSSFWLRAPHSGTVKLLKNLGDIVEKKECVAIISDVFGSLEFKVFSPKEGVVVGITRIPLVSLGDAMIHIATFDEENIQDIMDFSEDIEG